MSRPDYDLSDPEQFATFMREIVSDPQPYNEETGFPICPPCGKDIDPKCDNYVTVMETGVCYHDTCVPQSLFK